MPDAPLSPLVVSKEFCYRQQEDPPTIEGHDCGTMSMDSPQHLDGLCAISIEILKP